MQMSEHIDELATALAKAQGEIKAAKKDAEVKHLNRSYADLASVWEACREPLSKNGLAVSQLTVEAPSGHVAITTLLLHASGQYLRGETVMPLGDSKGMQAAQAYGSVLTYARRYALSALVGVAPDDDNDAEPSQPGTPAPATKPTPQPRPVAPAQNKATQQPAKGSTPAQRSAQIAATPAVPPKNGAKTEYTALGDEFAAAALAEGLTKPQARELWMSQVASGSIEQAQRLVARVKSYDYLPRVEWGKLHPEAPLPDSFADPEGEKTAA